MSYYDNAKEFRSKIETVLLEEGKVLTIRDNQYPITLIISQNQSPAAQMDLLADSDSGVSSKDSAIRIIFDLDGLMIHTDNRVVISDAAMTKLKGLAKKWHAAYTHAYFADSIRQKLLMDDAEPDCDNSADDADHDPFADLLAEAEDEAEEE